MVRIAIGQKAPELELPDSQGQIFKLSEQKGRFVVLFFYPMDGSMICTAENICVTRNFDDFEALGAIVVGISGGDGESKEKFRQRHALKQRLLVDAGRKAAAEWGAMTLGFIPGRATFIIDKDGIVRARHSGMFESSAHIEFALKELRRLAALSELGDS
ncbi:MAG: peroxiredoxin [Planctomycetota bacterium]